MTRFPPPSPESVERDAALQRMVQDAAIAHAALSPVDQALAYVDQRNSFVRGNLALDRVNVAAFDDAASVLADEVRRLRKHFGPLAQAGEFEFGRLVVKPKGSEWRGRVCGFYSTAATPLGYAVESDAHRGSVQIYPAAALAPSGADVLLGLANVETPSS